MQKHTVTLIHTDDPNVDVIDVQTDNIQFKTVNELLEYIRQDEINCAIEIAKRRYLRTQRKPEVSILHRFARKVAMVCM